MGIEYLQSNLSGGELAPSLHARTDIAKYDQSVAIAKNMVIVPQGGMRRRPGLAKTKDGYYTSDLRLEPFVFNQKQKYLMIFRPGFIDIMKDGELLATGIVLPISTMEEIDELDIIQSADTVIITHETVNPMKLVRGTDEHNWTLSDIPLVIPPYDFGAGDEPVWSDARGWPGVCTFHGGRLWLAGSTQKPTSVWGSRINGFFDFTWSEVDTVVPEDHAVFDTIDTNEYNKIINIFTGRKLQVFTTGAEFVNTVDFPTPSGSSWQQQTGYGSKRVRPILIDGATLYVDSSKRTIRQFMFDFNEDGFVSNNITLLSSHLLTDIKALRAIKGTTLDVSDYVYAINTDGTVAVMNTLRSEGLLGWTHWETQGEFIDVCVLSKEVYFLVKRRGLYFIEKLEENTYTDHNVLEKGIKPTTNNIIDGYANIADGIDNIVDTDYTNNQPVNSITTDYKDIFLHTDFKVIADFSIMPDSEPISDGTNLNHFTITRDAYRLEVGLDFSTEVLTLPIGATLKSGSTIHKRKRVVKADINVLESLGVYAQDMQSPDRQFTVVLNEAPNRFSGFKEMYLLGYDRIVQIKITQKEPLPLLLRGIGFEIVY